MIKTLAPYSTTAKTAEIMSRYRPIAPKREDENSNSNSSGMSQKIRQSPYLRNLWPQLQARPTRTRKRGRGSSLSPPVIKRQRIHHQMPIGLSSSPAKHLSMQGFLHGFSNQLPALHSLGGMSSSFDNSSLVTTPLTLPLLPPPSVAAVGTTNQGGMPPLHELMRCMAPSQEDIDLNTVVEVPEEKDLLRQLQEPRPAVIAPHPVRPVGSSIRVACINENTGVLPLQGPKKPEQVEEEVESDVLPAVISDSNNKVRLANSAYKEMVGQPECSWLNSMVTMGNGRLGCNSNSCCKRICGEVALHLSDSRVPVSSNGFSCWVRIEWGNPGKKSCISAFCDVSRLSCESKDYMFTWRFHTPARQGSQGSSNV
ncbi:unnamed protein product [Linum tenue]|uniref:DUF7950 domain-containing protein n=1 Tax=Linum tenue TaxID=586396 RepID=A0AAV0P1X8_9ROSI|nr:unnamed protein product [Linum tenue]